MISATSTTRHAGSNLSKTPSDRKCYPCLRNKTKPMCPERTPDVGPEVVDLAHGESAAHGRRQGDRMQVSEGKPYPLGATAYEKGANFAVFSANATKVEVCFSTLRAAAKWAAANFPSEPMRFSTAT